MSLYAMNLFIMEWVTWFGKKPVQVWKWIIVVSTEFLESRYKAVFKALQNYNYDRFLTFVAFSNAPNWPIHWKKERECLTSTWRVLSGVFCFSILFLRVLFLNNFFNEEASKLWLNLMNVTLLDNLRIFLNAFKLIVFIQHFCDTYILHIFVIHNNIFFVVVL